MTRVLVVGATSAIAEATARLFAAKGSRLFLVARDGARLEAVAADLRVRGAASVECAVVDLTDHERAGGVVAEAHHRLGGIDVALVAHGLLPDQQACERSFAGAYRSFDVNLLSAVAVLTPLATLMEEQGGGSLAVVSSVAGDRGRRSNYVYGAAKAGLSTYLSGLRARLHPAGVHVLTVKPGLVDTPMTAHLPKGRLWAQPDRVARGIVRALRKRRDVAYTPAIWRYVSLALRMIPERVFVRMQARRADRPAEEGRATGRDAPPRRNGLVVFLAFLLATRVAFALLTSAAAGGHEISDDVAMHVEMVRDPFAVLLGDTARNGQHPPLLPVVEAAVARPLLLVMPPFLAMRLAACVFECLAALLFWLALRRTAGAWRHAATAWVALPGMWMTSAVMAQDEMVAAAFVAGICWLVLARRPLAAVAVCALGAVAGKVFLLVPLLALVTTLPGASFRRKAIVAAGVVGSVTGFVVLAAWLRGSPAPLAGFTPAAQFGTNLWAAASVAPAAAKWISAGLAGGAVLAALAVVMRRAPAVAGAHQVALHAALLSIVFALFYHVNPEYLVLLVPPLLLLPGARFNAWVLGWLTATAWAANVCWIAVRAEGGGVSGAKARLGQWIREWIHGLLRTDSGTVWIALLSAATALTCVAAAVAWRATVPPPPGRAA